MRTKRIGINYTSAVEMVTTNHVSKGYSEAGYRKVLSLISITARYLVAEEMEAGDEEYVVMRQQ